MTWSSYQDEEVVVSGGVDLSGQKWTKSATNPAAYETTLPASAAGRVTTLFVNGVREIRAKFPNGDPLIPGGAGWAGKASGPSGMLPANGKAFNHTVTVLSSSGVLLYGNFDIGCFALF